MISSFGIVGGGFRSRIFLEVARALPQHFRVSAMVVRNPSIREDLHRQWDLPIYSDIDSLLAHHGPDFMVVAVPASASHDYIMALGQRQLPVLSETPPAADLKSLIQLYQSIPKGSKLQIAEQYPYRPMMAARLAMIESGRLGVITSTDVSISHGYHGVSLIRRLLSISYEPVTIRATRFSSPVWAGPTRQGPPEAAKLVTSRRDLAWLDFGGKLGVFDFTQDQHRSWIRQTRLAVRGERGELVDDEANVLTDYRTPVHLHLERVERGRAENVEGYYLSGITAGLDWLYQNPYAPARLNDEEIAVATCLSKMAAYAAGGPGFYGLEEAAQDSYLSLLIDQAIESGQSVASAHQPWMDEKDPA